MTNASLVSRVAGELALVTPSFTPDLARCELLVESLDRFAPELTHYLLIDKAEFPAFRHLASSRTVLVESEELIGLPQRHVRLGRSWWLSWKTLPMRGWMRQQLLKLAAARSLPEKAFVCLDSDVTFVRPLRAQQINRNGRWDLLDVDYVDSMVERWTGIAERLLGLEPRTLERRGHVGHLIVWTKRHVEELLARIETVADSPWQVAIGRQRTFSEYILYGAYIRGVVGYDNSDHYPSTHPFVRQPWGHDLNSQVGLADYVCNPEPGNIAVMVHSKFGISVAEVRQHLERCWNQAETDQ